MIVAFGVLSILSRMVTFRDSKKKIPNTCRKFFDDYRHLENHFKYLSNTSGLVERVEKNFKLQMGEHLTINKHKLALHSKLSI